MRHYRLGELLEGYFWLALGVALDLFDGPDARQVARYRLTDRFADFDEFFRDWGYLLDAQLITLFNSALNKREFLTRTSLSEFESPEQLTGAFDSILLLQTRFSASASVQQLLANVNFSPQTLTSLLESQSRNPFEGSLLRHFDGFVSSIEYMADCRQFFSDFYETRALRGIE